MADQWQWWRDALAGEFGPIHENEPASGFYRVGNDAVAIWHEDGQAVATRAGRKVEDVCALWTFAAKWPIPVETYEAVAEREEPWPDAIDVPAGVGHNAPSEHEAIEDELAALKASWERWLDEIGGAIATQEHSDKASTYSERVVSLEARANEGHRVEKKPHLEAGRAVDERWRSVRVNAETAKRHIKGAIGRWEIAEEKRREALAAQVRAETGLEVAIEPVRTKGAARAVTLRTVKKAEITDLPALAAFIAGMANPPADFTDTCRKVAEKMLLAGVEVPGAQIVTSKVAA